MEETRAENFFQSVISLQLLNILLLQMDRNPAS